MQVYHEKEVSWFELKITISKFKQTHYIHLCFKMLKIYYKRKILHVYGIVFWSYLKGENIPGSNNVVIFYLNHWQFYLNHCPTRTTHLLMPHIPFMISHNYLGPVMPVLKEEYSDYQIFLACDMAVTQVIALLHKNVWHSVRPLRLHV
jgi:hypothetical protein